MKYYLLLVNLLFFFFKAGAQEIITVNAQVYLKKVPKERVGINVNYLTDDQPNTEEALTNLGVKFLRFPGGEKSDNYFWGQWPFTQANHTLALTGNCHWPNNDSRFTQPDFKSLKPNTLDFDEFMAMAGKAGAQPLIVVNADGYHNTGSTCGGVPAKDSLLLVAQEWVRYANVVKKYKIKYWMIGNESFKSAAYAGNVKPENYRDDVIAFSRTLKAIDPTIKIIVNGNTDEWWKIVLSDTVATSYIDYLGISAYPVWNWEKGYQNYLLNKQNFTSEVRVAYQAIKKYVTNPIDRNRIRIIVTETNALDFSETGWKNTNDLAHSLVLFDIIGQHLLAPKVDFTFFWNTRWIDHKKENQGFNALSSSGKLLPNGKILSIWNKYLLDTLVQSTGTDQVISYASTSKNDFTLFLLNKDSLAHTVLVKLNNFINPETLERVVYTGNSLADSLPEIAAALPISSNSQNKEADYNIPLSPHSITVLYYKDSPSWLWLILSKKWYIGALFLTAIFVMAYFLIKSYRNRFI